MKEKYNTTLSYYVSLFFSNLAQCFFVKETINNKNSNTCGKIVSVGMCLLKYLKLVLIILMRKKIPMY